MPPKKDVDTLTPQEHLLVEYVIAHPDTSLWASAQVCGWKKGSIPKLLNRPRVKQAIEKALAAKTAAVVKAVAKKAVITKSIIEERAMQIANMDPADTKGNATAQVNALYLLAEMNGHIVQKTQDLTEESRGKSDEDKEFFAIHGYWPNLDTRQSSAAGREGENTGADKPN